MQYIQVLWRSFYSKECYRAFLKSDTPFFLKYLAVLVLVFTLLLSVRFMVNMYHNADLLAADFAGQLPAMRLTKGQLYTPAEKTYRIFFRTMNTKYIVGVVNTSPNYQKFSSSGALVWAGRNAIHFQYAHYKKMRVYPKKSLIISQQKAYQLIHAQLITWGHLLGLIFLVGIFLLSFSAFLIASWGLSVVMKSLARSFSVTLSTKSARNLALVSFTPFLLLLGVFYMVSWVSGLSFVIMLAALAFYPVRVVQSLQ